MENLKPKFNFKKKERLASKKNIANVIQKGKQIKIFPFFVRFLITEESDSIAKLLIAVPKKKVKLAVKRNKIKRLIREAYRTNNDTFYDCLNKNNVKILISISYFGTKILKYDEIQDKIINIFELICKNITK